VKDQMLHGNFVTNNPLLMPLLLHGFRVFDAVCDVIRSFHGFKERRSFQRNVLGQWMHVFVPFLASIYTLVMNAPILCKNIS